MLCKQCGFVKSENDISKSRPGWCKTCWSQYMRNYYATNPEQKAKHLQRTNRWNNANRERWMKAVRVSHIRCKYGITQEIADETLKNQGDACAICRDLISSVKPPKIDHCHKTGLFRGILCQSCNTGLGMLKDSPSVLLRALHYITRPRERKHEQ